MSVLTTSTVRSTTRTGYHIHRLRIGHAPVCQMTFAEAVDALVDHAATAATTACVVTPNAQHVVLLEKDARFRSIYAQAEYVLPDGVSLLFGAWMLGRRLQERITGVDLFQALCARAASYGLRVFLLGGLPGSAEKAARTLQARYPELKIAGIHVPPVGFEKDPVYLEGISHAIRVTRPHLLFVALGAPKQEFWMEEHGRKLRVPVCVGIGGSFEMVSGITPRAPRWMQTYGLEWAFRLAVEPRRLWKRYLVGNLQFLWIILKQMVGVTDHMHPGAEAGWEK